MSSESTYNEIGSEETIVKLSESGRISLSDITAATIGNLTDSVHWGSPLFCGESEMSSSNVVIIEGVPTQADDNVTIQSDSGITSQVTEAGSLVLRPWEERTRQVQVSAAHTITQENNPPPTYLESMKRKRVQQNDGVNNSGQKRKRVFPDSTTTGDLSSIPLPGELEKNDQQTFLETDAFCGVSKHGSGQSSAHRSATLGDFLTTLQQASMPVAQPSGSQQVIQNTTDVLKTSATFLHQYGIEKQNKNETPSTIPADSTPSYFPLLQSLPLTLSSTLPQGSFTNQQSFQSGYQSQYLSPQISSLNNESVHPKQTMDYSVQNLLQHRQVNFASPGINMSNTGSMQNIKMEAVTPAGKGLKPMGIYDNSPAMESRLTDSLHTLLGSPPPDSPMSRNPFFGDLQNLLSNECKREIIPQSLFGMKPKLEDDKKENVFTRERNLQERFTSLQETHPEEVKQLSSVFRYQSALIETERFRTLHECQYPGSYKESVNSFYDDKLHKVMDRVERSIGLLENAERDNRPRNKVPKPRPHLSKAAVRLMEQWYKVNTEHPYPDNTTIELLAQTGNIGVEQVKKWFANKRNRTQNTRSLTEIAIQKRKLGQLTGKTQFA